MNSYYNIEQVSKITGMSASTIYHHTMQNSNCRRQLLPMPYQRRPVLLWQKQAIDEWQEKYAQEACDFSEEKKYVPKKEPKPIFDNAAAVLFLTRSKPVRRGAPRNYGD